MDFGSLGPLTIRQRIFWFLAILFVIVCFIALALATNPFFVPCNGSC